LRLRRLYRFCRWTLGWLVNLKLFFQLLNQRGNFFLPFRFDLLPQRSFHFSAFLDVARFELSAFLRVQVEARVADRRVRLAPDGLSSQILSLPHDVAFCGTHPPPAFCLSLVVAASRRRGRHA